MNVDDTLHGCSVIVVGAGLAGLTAAVDLEQRGAHIRIIEARNRVGGRVWTLREGWANGQHAEAGGDLIDEDQEEIKQMASRLGLKLVPILRGGFGFAMDQGTRRPPRVFEKGRWRGLSELLAPWIREYRLADQRWDSLAAQSIARLSVADWLSEIKADQELWAFARGLRGFFLADAEHVSLLMLVDQFADDVPGHGHMYRIAGGNDRLATALKQRVHPHLQLQTHVTAIKQSFGQVRVRLHDGNGAEADISSDYVIMAVPAPALQQIAWAPALPKDQAKAIRNLRYGKATRTMCQFRRRFWRRRGRPNAFGTDLPIGAVWDGNEEQKGPYGILSFLAGGSASVATQHLLAKGDMNALSKAVGWLGEKENTLVASRMISWENDPWAGGGYAYFDSTFDPAWRLLLARPHGRILFAGEHTSLTWQGYMNGAVESGFRAAAEVRMLVQRNRGR